MKVRVKLSDFLARMVRETKFEVKVHAGSTVADLISLLVGRFGNDFHKALIDQKGGLNGSIIVVLNGQLIATRQIAEITINHKSNLSIIALTGGG